MKPKIRYAWGQSSLGAFIAAASQHGLLMVAFGMPEGSLVAALCERFPEACVDEDSVFMTRIVQELVELIEQPHSASLLAVDLHGSDFQRRVWHALRAIPAGETVCYGNIAAQLGVPKDAREVASACAANTLAVLIPCHRVVKKDGSISGYRWGVQRKRALLAREARA